MKTVIKYKFLFDFETFIWISGLIFLYLINVNGSSHFTFCPLKNLGINFCPGCGLGRSIHYFLHLEIMKSFQSHPLGIFAFFILLNRIIFLLKENFIKEKLLKKEFQQLKKVNYYE